MELSNSLPEDYQRCPITQGILLNPVAANPCGHLFERTPLEKWMMEQEKKCPLCRREITSLSPQEAARNETHRFITSHPELFGNKSPLELEREVHEEYASMKSSEKGVSRLYIWKLLAEHDPVTDPLRLTLLNYAFQQAAKIQLGSGNPVVYRDYSGTPNEALANAQGNEVHFRVRMADDDALYCISMNADGSNFSIVPVEEDIPVQLGDPLLKAFLYSACAALIPAVSFYVHTYLSLPQ